MVRNDNTLWVTGGSNPNKLASTEYVTMTGTMPGPDLPLALEQHAMVAINSSCSMVIGGRKNAPNWSDSSYVSATFIYDHNEGKWITGPSLIQSRDSHAAGIVTDEVTDEQFVVVTGGYYYLDSTEILQDGEWVQGKINNNVYTYAIFWRLSGSRILLENEVVLLHCFAY